MTKGAVLCVSHGGGPLPLLNDPAHTSITSSLRNRAPKVLGLGLGSATPPRAIIVVTAHWQTETPCISSAASPPLLYDYGGFPPEAYAVKYPAPGHPQIAAEVHSALEAEGLEPRLDPDRGWDHGVFVPLLLMRPQADVPIVQLSVLQSEDAAAHLRYGRALAALREDNVAILGSGFASFHNRHHMIAMMTRPASPPGRPPAEQQRQAVQSLVAWNEGLVEALKTAERAARDAKIANWRGIRGSYDAHLAGAADHLMPLWVCAGAAGAGEEVKMYGDSFLGVDILSFYWGGVEEA